MGSQSDWETLQHCAAQLDDLGISYTTRVVSAHRTPLDMVEFATRVAEDSIAIVIAAAGGAAHLPGMVASMTPLPVIGVPVQSQALSGVDSLLSIVQMPGGVPVGTMAIGKAGAINAALYAARILGVDDPTIREAVRSQMDRQRDEVRSSPIPGASS